MFFMANTVGFDAKNEMLILIYWSKSLQIQWVAESISRQSLNPNRQFHMYIYFNPLIDQIQYYPLHLFLLSFYLKKKKASEIQSATVSFWSRISNSWINFMQFFLFSCLFLSKKACCWNINSALWCNQRQGRRNYLPYLSALTVVCDSCVYFHLFQITNFDFFKRWWKNGYQVFLKLRIKFTVIWLL